MKQNILFQKADNLAHLVYRATRDYPKEEVYGLISQMRRAAVSVPVNIVEGYARKGDKSYRQFLLISYGSLKELKYLLKFSEEEGYLDQSSYNELFDLSKECAKLLWTTIQTIEAKSR